MKGFDKDGAEGEAGVVGGRLGDGVGVFAANYGELLIGVFGELRELVSKESGKEKGGSIRFCGFHRRGRGGWMVLDGASWSRWWALTGGC